MRLFVALDLPWAVRERLADLGVGLAGARWVPPENYHITLRFIGETPSYRAEEVDAALSALRGRAFPIELAGAGTHEKNGRVTALWVGVARSQPLEHLRSKIETAVQRAGIPPERRRFTPHVTLARLRDQAAEPKLAGWVQAHNLFRTPPVDVQHFTLFSSQLGKEQSVYTPEVEYPLL